MARVTIEDCIKNVENRFDLVILAARRAREIAAGVSITVERDNDKNPVVALREIAENNLDLAALKESVIKSMQRNILSDSYDDDSEETVEDNFQAEQWQGSQGQTTSVQSKSTEEKPE